MIDITAKKAQNFGNKERGLIIMNFFQRRKLKKLLEQVEKERIETLERCLEFWKNTAYEYQNKYYDLKQNEG